MCSQGKPASQTFLRPRKLCFPTDPGLSQSWNLRCSANPIWAISKNEKSVIISPIVVCSRWRDDFSFEPGKSSFSSRPAFPRISGSMAPKGPSHGKATVDDFSIFEPSGLDDPPGPLGSDSPNGSNPVSPSHGKAIVDDFSTFEPSGLDDPPGHLGSDSPNGSNLAIVTREAGTKNKYVHS